MKTDLSDEPKSHYFISDLDLVARAEKVVLDAASRIFDDLHDVKGSDGVVSKTLSALGDKIHHMITDRRGHGTPSSVEPMLRAMLRRGVKKQRRPIGGFVNNGFREGDGQQKWEFLGYGHFRWDWKAYTLEPWELDWLNLYFHLHEPYSLPDLVR